MRLAPNSLSLRHCDELYDLPLYFGGEQESLPTDCGPSRAIAPQKSLAHPPAVTFSHYRQSLRNPGFVPQAIRMALVIGSIVFTVNHGKALLQNEMTGDRWISGALSFVTPYLVSIYGQTQCELNRNPRKN